MKINNYSDKLVKEEEYTEYKNKLICSFPKALKNDIEVVLGIIPFNKNDFNLNYKAFDLIHPTNLSIQLGSELLTIPCRLYFNEPDRKKENKLTEIQKTILNCIYLRHYNGYVRQGRLEQLIGKNEYWVTPFTFQLLGEYVFEILVILNKYINNKNIDNYKRFVNENPKYWQQTESRIISYWNAYYRRFKLKDYLGQQIIDRIKNLHS